MKPNPKQVDEVVKMFKVTKQWPADYRTRVEPGWLAGSTPLEQWCVQGRWPARFGHFLEALEQQRGKQDGARAMVDLLLVMREEGYGALRQAIEKTLEMGYSRVSTLLLLLSASKVERRGSIEPVEVGSLSRYDHPQPTTVDCDQSLRKWPESRVLQ